MEGRGRRCVRACACARASGGVVVLVLYGEGAGWSGVLEEGGGGGVGGEREGGCSLSEQQCGLSVQL